MNTKKTICLLVSFESHLFPACFFTIFSFIPLPPLPPYYIKKSHTMVALIDENQCETSTSPMVHGMTLKMYCLFIYFASSSYLVNSPQMQGVHHRFCNGI